ncbi:MAG: hypothetical protein GF419_12385 [Ignavibacteriales bacterium]|nr:hypothetical protein [Ignavibacteriales bacterium]
MRTTIRLAAGIIIIGIAAACGGEKTEKERALAFHKEYAVYAMEASARVPTPGEAPSPVLDEKETRAEEIAREHGFENLEEAVAATGKYADSPEMIELKKDLEKKFERY